MRRKKTATCVYCKLHKKRLRQQFDLQCQMSPTRTALFVCASALGILSGVLLCMRTETSLDFELTLAGVDPEDVASFVFDAKNAKTLNPLIIYFDVMDRDDENNTYSANYAEHLPLFGVNKGYSSYQLRKNGGGDKEVYFITSDHRNCVLWDLFCTNSYSVMIFRRGVDKSSFFTERVTVQCPTMMKAFCIEQTLENRQNWLQQLRTLMSRKKNGHLIES